MTDVAADGPNQAAMPIHPTTDAKELDEVQTKAEPTPEVAKPAVEPQQPAEPQQMATRKHWAQTKQEQEYPQKQMTSQAVASASELARLRPSSWLCLRCDLAERSVDRAGSDPACHRTVAAPFHHGSLRWKPSDARASHRAQAA